MFCPNSVLSKGIIGSIESAATDIKNNRQSRRVDNSKESNFQSRESGRGKDQKPERPKNVKGGVINTFLDYFIPYREMDRLIG